MVHAQLAWHIHAQVRIQLDMIGVSQSQPHNRLSVTALSTCVCIYAC